MIALERNLSGYRYLSIQDINNAADDTLKKLRSSTQLVEAAAQKFLDSSTQAHDAIVGANDVVHKTFAPAVQRLDDTISALSNAALVHKDMVQHVQKVQSDFVTQMAKLEQGVITVLSAVDSQMNSVMQNVDGQISAAATTLGAASKSAMADVTRVAQDVATSASRHIGQQMQSFSSSFDQAVRDLGGLANSLDTTISALNSTSNSVMVNTATLADDLHAIHEDLQQTILRLRA
jgi:prefoldin subunit 5